MVVKNVPEATAILDFYENLNESYDKLFIEKDSSESTKINSLIDNKNLNEIEEINLKN